MEIEQTPNSLRIRMIGIQWVVINSSIGLLLVIASASLLISDNWTPRLWGAGLLLLGGAVLLITLLTVPLWTVYTFDKMIGVVRSEHKTILYPKVIEWRLQDIQSIQVDAEEDSDRMTHYVINLVSTSGKILQLREVTNNPDKQAYEPIAKQIRQFLDLSD
ncbi:MAG: hypothetical protein KME45_01250 [Stenomitos rutilans HA7619-LM2]|jgi:hypothetical protein|nr:hypothetical protein [Stenomitos rutilans HA7619-LM2]